MKKCRICKVLKNNNEFRAAHPPSLRVRTECSLCTNALGVKRTKTVDGLITKMYCAQRASSRHRNHPMPDYSNKEFKTWVLSQDNFMSLYEDWKNSGYSKNKTPSPDRIDDYKPYTLANLSLTTWENNKKKGEYDMRNGINNKQSIPVIRLSSGSDEECEYFSLINASRETGVDRTSIARVCRNESKTAGGFRWRFK